MKHTNFKEPSLRALPFVIAAWLIGVAALGVLLASC